jgi:hypothetical protein
MQYFPEKNYLFYILFKKKNQKTKPLTGWPANQYMYMEPKVACATPDSHRDHPGLASGVAPATSDWLLGWPSHPRRPLWGWLWPPPTLGGRPPMGFLFCFFFLFFK